MSVAREYVIRLSPTDAKCHSCNKGIAKKSLRMDRPSTKTNRQIHISCISQRTAQNMMHDEETISDRVVFFCTNEDHIDVFEQIKRKAFGVRGTPKKESHGKCVVCMECDASFACVPCGHRCLCQHCADKLTPASRCPMCRKPKSQLIRVFL